MGIIAAVRSRAPIDVMLQAGDALLASPLTVVAISPGSRQPWETIAELRARFGRNLQIGAGPMSDLAAIRTAIDAGAQFVLSGPYSPVAGEFCRRRDVLYLPAAAAASQAVPASNHAWPLQLVFPAGRDGVAAIQCRQVVNGDARLVPMGGVTTENLASYARVGAAAAVVRGVIGAHATWRMAAMITQMRRVRALWEAGRSGQAGV